MKKIDHNVLSDLGINVRSQFGQLIPVFNCFHCFSDGARTQSLFQTTDDFKLATNKLAVAVAEFDVILLAFCLMSNHFHLILYGNEDICRAFLGEYARRLMMSKPSSETTGIPVALKPIPDDGYLKTAICYVLKNPVAARMPYLPNTYPFSSGFLLFAAKNGENPWLKPFWLDSEATAMCYADLSYREKRKLTRSKKDIPGEWRITDGLIFPGDFVAYNLCERIFGTTRSFNYFMSSGKELDEEKESFSPLSIPDSEMKKHRDEIALALFGTTSVRSLSATQRGVLAKRLKSQFGCPVKQLSRLVRLDANAVQRFLSS